MQFSQKKYQLRKSDLVYFIKFVIGEIELVNYLLYSREQANQQTKRKNRSSIRGIDHLIKKRLKEKGMCIINCNSEGIFDQICWREKQYLKRIQQRTAINVKLPRFAIKKLTTSLRRFKLKKETNQEAANDKPDQSCLHYDGGYKSNVTQCDENAAWTSTILESFRAEVVSQCVMSFVNKHKNFL